MKFFFDTSVLIAAFIDAHPKHEISLSWLNKAQEKGNSLVITAHSLAECYAVLTSMPIKPRIKPEIARSLIEENLAEIAEIVPLNIEDYYAVLNDLTILGLSGGIIYDALLIKGAQKANADKILTLNVEDFKRFGSEISERVLAI